jgi:hypothetical protein
VFCTGGTREGVEWDSNKKELSVFQNIREKYVSIAFGRKLFLEFGDNDILFYPT